MVVDQVVCPAVEDLAVQVNLKVWEKLRRSVEENHRRLVEENHSQGEIAFLKDLLFMLHLLQ
jgi:hypothetical protein